MIVADQFVVEFDKALRAVFAPAPTRRPVPGSELPETSLSEAERKHVVGLMRVNHVGEICAQALYQGQALTSRNEGIRVALREAAEEETEHLAWTERRIAELGGRKCVFNPLWYLGALTIGATAGALGDGWNLGFLAETERQVEAHLDGHLSRLPSSDAKSLAVVEQMRVDEIRHAETAVRLGAVELPGVVKGMMRLAAKVMTATAYRI